jgi:hypothetical protein
VEEIRNAGGTVQDVVLPRTRRWALQAGETWHATTTAQHHTARLTTVALSTGCFSADMQSLFPMTYMAGSNDANATGSPFGPNLRAKKWLWSDGSYAGTLKTIREGVRQPKEYRSPMPPMGGAQLTSDQLAAVSTYFWALSH